MSIINTISIIIVTALIAISAIYSYCKNQNTARKTSIDIEILCDKYKIGIWILLIAIFFISVIYKFGTFPHTLFVDEAGTIYDARSLSEYGVDRYLKSFPIYLINFGGGQSALLCYLMIFFIKIFGSNIISYRLPMLFIYSIGAFASYRMILKNKDKKMAFIFLFLVITLPWNITSTRRALDCNLYAGMFMIDLFLMNRAEKNYQYVLAGTSVGITLYTYSMSWITLPVFLIFWIIYMLYLKKINLKQIFFFGLPIIVLATPLLLFILVNYKVIPEFNIGPFAVPQMSIFRKGEISILKIFKYGPESLMTLLGYKDTIYPAYIPLIIIGFGITISDAIKKFKKKEYDIGLILSMAFIILLLGISTTRNQTPNKLNVLYIPMMYFVTISIIKLFQNLPQLLLINIVLIVCLFANFEFYYYTKIEESYIDTFFDDNSYYKLVDIFENQDELKEAEKYVLIYKAEGYIYQLYSNYISPYEFNSKKETHYTNVKKIDKYHYYHILHDKEKFYGEDFNQDNSIVIVSKNINDKNEELEQKFDKAIEFMDLVIYADNTKGEIIESIIEEKYAK